MSSIFNKNKFFIIIILILLGIVIFGLTYYSNRVHNLEYKLDSQKPKTDTIYIKPKVNYTDSAKVKDSVVIIPKINYIDSLEITYNLSYDTVQIFDTIQLIEDFYSLNYYRDSLTVQDVDVKVLDILQKNRIFAREYIITNNRTEEFFKKREIYLGSSLMGNNNSFMFGPTLGYKDKKDNMLSVNYLINSGGDNMFLLSFSKKINLKR